MVEPDFLTQPIPSPYPALVRMLKDDATVHEMTAGRVFAGRMPVDLEGLMPIPMVVMSTSGGRPMLVDAGMWHYRMRAGCYAGQATSERSGVVQAHYLALAVMRCLHGKQTVVDEKVVLSSIICTAGPIEMRDTTLNGAQLVGLYFVVLAPLWPVLPVGGAS